jgi:hypothetical protein
MAVFKYSKLIFSLSYGSQATTGNGLLDKIESITSLVRATTGR